MPSNSEEESRANDQEARSMHEGVRISFVSADFTREDEISNLCADIIKLYPEGIDILVNNAGFNSVHAVESYPVATWHKMMAVHLTAPFLLSKFFVPYMKKKVFKDQIEAIARENNVPFEQARVRDD
ncbi:uncharacterized oxidoreductase YxjF-like [Dreissena polymorpha]|uniref:uncharacterized oxidoreductase YxjF-like n=1 Tax=Dreissena polymorpha TaxID=45954 RepID=UPI0022642D71|nr:uncharacterized oxidoreductase YxjF-like [Dreissena polymorpha]